MFSPSSRYIGACGTSEASRQAGKLFGQQRNLILRNWAERSERQMEMEASVGFCIEGRSL